MNGFYSCLEEMIGELEGGLSFALVGRLLSSVDKPIPTSVWAPHIGFSRL